MVRQLDTTNNKMSAMLISFIPFPYFSPSLIIARAQRITAQANRD